MNNSAETIMTEPPSAVEGIIGLLIAIAVLIVLSMIFSSSESAFLSINKLRIRFLQSKKNKKAIKVEKLLNKKEQLLNTVLVGNNIVNIAITSLLTSLSVRFFGQAGVGIATLVATILLLIFGEITPKTIGTRHSESIAFLFSGIISLTMKLLSPLVFIFTRISRMVTKLFGINLDTKKVSFTEEEIKNLIDIGEEEGILEENEKNMMHRVFKFTDLAAKDIMIPRTHIKAIPLTATYDEILRLSQEKRLSRFPVYKDDIDDIVGILYVKDLLIQQNNTKDFSVKNIMRPPLFVIGTKKMSSVQQLLREKKQSLAVVIDEYSGTDGILTIEDITEEIFGTISDEYKPELNTEIQNIQPDMIIDGTTRLSTISEQLNISLKSDFYDTIAGYISEKLDKIPEIGDKITDSNFIFTVTEADETKISKVHISNEVPKCN